jgi:pilus assembly protein CpaC
MGGYLRSTAFLILAILWAPLLMLDRVEAASADRQTLEVKLGGSDLITASHPVKRVTIANPDVADVVVLSPREIYVYGKQVGYTSLILWEGGEGKTLLDVVVSLDLTSLKEKIHQLYPNDNIKVYGTETGIVLSGTVAGPEVVEQVLRLTQSYFPKEGEGGKGQQGTGRSGVGITNLLTVSGNQQIMLEVKFAEVTRNSDKEWQAALGLGKLGSDFTGAAGVGSVVQPFEFPSAADVQQFGLTPGPAIFPGGGVGQSFESIPHFGNLVQFPSSLLMNFAGNPANIFVNINNFTAALRFLETEGLARVLAEPRLVTQSGQEASFLAGGEFPIPVAQDVNTITIEFKEFGVALRFTPVLLSDGKISLRVAPSVSEISSTSVIPSGIVGANFVVPNLSTRKLETNVQLHDGQTLAIAGLLQDNLRESVEKIPGLGDLPILGSLFRSTNYRQQKTDLLIAVTPHIVKPVKEGSIEFPGEYMKPPNRYEFYLEGRLEGRRDDVSAMSRHEFTGAIPASRTSGLEGDFGYQPVSGITEERL